MINLDKLHESKSASLNVKTVEFEDNINPLIARAITAFAQLSLPTTATVCELFGGKNKTLQ